MRTYGAVDFMEIVLHPIEVEVLKALKGKDSVNLEDLVDITNLSIDQIRRGVEWLKEKKLIETSEDMKIFAQLGSAGIKCVTDGLPERQIHILLTKKGVYPLETLKKELKMDEKEFSAALGLAIKKNLVKVLKDKGHIQLEANPPKELATESLISKLFSQKEIEITNLTPDEKGALEELKKRPNYLLFKEVKKTKIKATSKAFELLEEYLKKSYVDKLTPELIITEKWKAITFRPYNIESPVPLIYPGKKHPVQDFIDRVREIFLSFGFEEIEGPIVLPSFWNFDALFIPQDHPARDMQDTFYLKGLLDKEIKNKAPINVIQNIHENGGNTGSHGWNYKWSLDEAEKVVLRTHTTPITVQYLYKNRPKSAKVFSVDKVFRNENLDNRHLFEFYQYEGIVTGRNVTLRHLIGVLSAFYKELGFEKVKFWPTFFPYTEPSLEAVAYVERLGKWIELCGMGVFRPEVTLPAGVKNPVLAWGGGLERLIMLAYNVEEIRFLYKNSLSWLRGVSYARPKY
jgi:phenylalanyl-tRNA synthetase alpha chain